MQRGVSVLNCAGASFLQSHVILQRCLYAKIAASKDKIKAEKDQSTKSTPKKDAIKTIKTTSKTPKTIPKRASKSKIDPTTKTKATTKPKATTKTNAASKIKKQAKDD